jgi:hypothetical protein
MDSLRVVWLAMLTLLAGFLPANGQEVAPTVSPEDAVDLRLVNVRRVCVSDFGTDALGIQIQEVVIAKLFQAKRFSLTEDCEKADFVVKGTIIERSDYATRSESEGIGFGQSGSSSRSSSSRFGSTGSSSGSSVSGSVSGNAYESLSSSEVKSQAALTMRIVDRDGEIIWATSQESGEGKSKGAFTLAAEQAVRRLLRDMVRAEKQARTESPSP